MSTTQAKSIFRQKENMNKLMQSLPKSGRKKKVSGPLTSVLVPLPKEGKDIEWYAITDGPTIEKVILKRNRRHFSQAGETPLATNEIVELFGPEGDTEFAQSILDGTADLSKVTDDKITQLLLDLMRKEKTVNIEITREDMMNKYKKWDEKNNNIAVRSIPRALPCVISSIQLQR